MIHDGTLFVQYITNQRDKFNKYNLQLSWNGVKLSLEDGRTMEYIQNVKLI